MDFLKKVGERAESLLEKADSVVAETAKDLKDEDKRALLNTAKMLEKRSNTSKVQNDDNDVESLKARIVQMQKDLETAGEVLLNVRE